MKKNVAFCFILVMFLGCSYNIEKVITDPVSILRDPHYAQYQKALDELESEYLQKNITYAEYLEKKNQLEEDYTREVQEREQEIESFR